MKIISIGPAYPLRGGIAKFNESFTHASIVQGFDAEIVSFKFLYPSILFPGKTQFTTDPSPAGLKIRSIIHPLSPINWISAAKTIADLNPDVIIFHYWMPFFAPVMGSIARRLKGKKIGIIHNLLPHEKQTGSELFTRYFLKSLDGVICLSSSVMNELKGMYPVFPSLCIPHPLYEVYGTRVPRATAVDHLGLDHDLKYILFFGLIRKYKGLDLLLKAFALAGIPGTKLIVAGEFYEDKTKYIRMIDELGISGNVILTGSYIPDEEVKYYFSAADLVVQPYISASQSGVTQIAFQFECPMLVTDTGGLSEIVQNGKTGFVCRIDPADIAGHIKIFFSENRAPKMIENIRIEKQRFSWNKFITNTIDFARSL